MAESTIRAITNYKVAYGSKIFADVTGNQDTTLEVDDQFPSDAHVVMLVPVGYSVSSSWATRLVFKEIAYASNNTTITGFRVRTDGTTTQTYTIRYWMLYY